MNPKSEPKGSETPNKEGGMVRKTLKLEAFSFKKRKVLRSSKRKKFQEGGQEEPETGVTMFDL